MDPSKAEQVIERARLLALDCRIVGRTGGEALEKPGEDRLLLQDLRLAHESWLPSYLQ